MKHEISGKVSTLISDNDLFNFIYPVDYAHNPYISPYSLSSYQCPEVCQLPIETTFGYDENKENNWPSLIWQTPIQIDSSTSEVDTENLTDHLISLAH